MKKGAGEIADVLSAVYTQQAAQRCDHPSNEPSSPQKKSRDSVVKNECE